MLGAPPEGAHPAAPIGWAHGPRSAKRDRALQHKPLPLLRSGFRGGRLSGRRGCRNRYSGVSRSTQGRIRASGDARSCRRLSLYLQEEAFEPAADAGRTPPSNPIVIVVEACLGSGRPGVVVRFVEAELEEIPVYGALPSVALPAGAPDVAFSEAFEVSFVWHEVVGVRPIVEQAPDRLLSICYSFLWLAGKSVRENSSPSQVKTAWL